MEEEIRPFIKKYHIIVKRRYIDNEPELVRRYGDKVPVLTQDEHTLCEYFLDPEPLLSAINAQSGSSTR